MIPTLPQVPSSPKETVSQTPSVTPTVKVEKRQVTCFTCHQKGHESLQFPQKVSQVRRVQIPFSKVVSLKDNELFGCVGGHSMPVTCDSGADITVVPEECVTEEQFSGNLCEVHRCNIVVNIAGRDFHREAVTQPGQDQAWTASLTLTKRRGNSSQARQMPSTPCRWRKRATSRQRWRTASSDQESW